MSNINEIKALVSLLDDEDEEVIGHISQKIISLGMIIVPFLEQEWQMQKNVSVQNRIENLIRNLHYGGIKTDMKNWVVEKQEDLLEGLWILNRYRYPNLELKELKKSIDDIFYDIWLSHRTYQSPYEQIKHLNDIFFNRWQFKRNNQAPQNPDNAMLNWVLQTRQSNPIGLCVIYMLIAQRLRMPVYGVNFPNIFILMYQSEETTFYINVFEGGLVFYKTDIDEYLKKSRLPQNEKFYIPCTHKDILVRMCRNLLNGYEMEGEDKNSKDINELLKILI
ncbi:MAG: hypothetical protein EAZ44_04625 [Cytophagia bacterium]|nr:MAG: hypothetical protein EAY69_03345 [Cytophagales bacterium]TAG04553.1 MAG: hypothetical protein EAZ44_04625 [Cytophagia bacterium]TAG43387.1 MAG: hypothetical protein EAZ31_04350 [Cytophagia bacterium]